MLTNKCYLTAKYQNHSNEFLDITVNEVPYILYIGNFKNIDKIIIKLKNDLFFNAICRIRKVYEPEYPIFNPRLLQPLKEYFTSLQNPNLIWLEAIKLTTLPEAKLAPIQENSYFKLQDTYKALFPYLNTQIEQKIPELTIENEKILVTIHGNLSKDNLLIGYRILKVEGNGSIPHKKFTTPMDSQNMPQELLKFNL